MAKAEQRNIELDDETWKFVSVMAAHKGMYKKGIVKEAIHFLYNHSFLEEKKKNGKV